MHWADDHSSIVLNMKYFNKLLFEIRTHALPIFGLFSLNNNVESFLKSRFILTEPKI